MVDNKNNNEKMPVWKKKVKRFIRNNDQYGHPIALTYNKSSTYKSFSGGLFTIISYMGILAFLALQIKDVINKKNSVTNTEKIVNLSLDTTQLQLNIDNYDIAIRVNYLNSVAEPDIAANLHQYINVRFQQYDTYWTTIDGVAQYVDNITEMDLNDCTGYRFLGEKETTEAIKIHDGYFCPTNHSFILQGGWQSEDSKYIAIVVDSCKQEYLDKHYPGEKCISNKTEIDRVIYNCEVFLPVLKQYFDFESFDSNDDPINNSIEFLYFTTDPETQQNYVYYLAQNFAILQDSYLSSSIGQRNLTFYQPRFSTYYEYQAMEEVTPLTIYFVRDPMIKTVTRECYTIANAMSAAGGFLGIIIATCKTLLKSSQQNQFFSSIISKLFLFQDEVENNKTEKHQSQININVGDNDMTNIANEDDLRSFSS